jgi:hypothetical protein
MDVSQRTDLGVFQCTVVMLAAREHNLACPLLLSIAGLDFKIPAYRTFVNFAIGYSINANIERK